MTTWITKNLTLDLLAITIDGLNKIFNRINQDTPVDAAMAHPADLPAPSPENTPADGRSTPGAPRPDESPAPEQAPAVDVEKLLPEAQNELRLIAQSQGNDWILGTLFPHFGVQTLTDVPAERLPELITMARAQNQAAA